MNAPLRLGVIGLGRAFTLMLPTFARHPLIKLSAATDPRPDARSRFAEDFDATSYETAEQLCADPSVQAVYVASPHQFHKAHVRTAAIHGKHILVEKPMALTVEDCREMIAAAREHGVKLLVGHSHSYDTPYLRARDLIRSGAYGDVRMITAVNYTDFLYRPRRPEELDTNAGGGVVFSQAAHQIDVVRLLAGRKAVSVRAISGLWDASRPTEGAYNGQIRFEGGSFASMTYSGYGRFDTDEFNDWVGKLGQRRDPKAYGSARKLLKTAVTMEDEIALKNRRAYGPAGTESFQTAGGLDHNHFGLVVVSCERADLRPTSRAITIFGEEERTVEPLETPDIPRAEVVDELYDAAILGGHPLHSGEWGLATLEICLAILDSAKRNEEIALRHQI